MTLLRSLALAAAFTLGSLSSAAARVSLQPVPRNAQTGVVQAYLRALRAARYDNAYDLLDSAERAYYRDATNLASVYAADAYRITAFSLLGARGDDVHGRVFFARETARFRDHAHDVDLTVAATVPVGVVSERGGWRIKDPGHPWRAFAAHAAADMNGLQISVKKVSFFTHRIEAVVSFVNRGTTFVTALPYGRSLLSDAGGETYRVIETRNWSLTDKTLFEGLRLAPGAEYTGFLSFACAPLDNTARTFSLTVAPLLLDGADAPFRLDIEGIAAAPAGAPNHE
jgi:hypothetical protein